MTLLASSGSKASFAYRADLDGLRAVAILAVVAFHVAPYQVTGGFVGVDVFFVLSGFLITGILSAQVDTGGLRLGRFFLSRFRRLLPALAPVLVAVWAVGWWTLWPEQYQSLLKHLAACSTFTGNILLGKEIGYFDIEAELKPILHLWSLGVEMQFYVLFPLFLLAALRCGVSLRAAITIGLVISFAFNLWQMLEQPAAIFYSAGARFWEMLVGALLAAHGTVVEKFVSDRGWANALSWTGLGGVAMATAGLYGVGSPYPGVAAMLPVLSTALIVAAGSGAWVNRMILARPILVFIGLISYPLYLWHWPLLSYLHIVGMGVPLWKWAAVVTSCMLAVTTYKFIEMPVRFSARGRRGHFGLLACAGVLVAFAGTALTGGPPARLSTHAFADQLDWSAHGQGWSQCELIPKGCSILDPSRSPGLAVIGDSHAAHLAHGVKAVAANVNPVLLVHYGCYPVLPIRVGAESFFDCEQDLIRKALQVAIETSSIHTVMLSGYANLALTGHRMHETQKGPAQEQRAKAFESTLTETIERLLGAGKLVIYIMDVPELLDHPQSCLRQIMLPTAPACRLARETLDERNAPYRRIAERLRARFPSVLFVDPVSTLCDQQYCYAGRSDGLYYQTRDHLTPVGSVHLLRANAQDISRSLLTH